MVLATLAEVAEVWEVLAKVLATPVWAKLAAEVLEVLVVEDWAQAMGAIQAVAVLVARVLGDQWGDQASADLAKLRPKDGEPRLEFHGC